MWCGPFSQNSSICARETINVLFSLFGRHRAHLYILTHTTKCFHPLNKFSLSHSFSFPSIEWPVYCFNICMLDAWLLIPSSVLDSFNLPSHCLYSAAAKRTKSNSLQLVCVCVFVSLLYFFMRTFVSCTYDGVDD